MENIEKIIEYLSPNEKKILPYLKEKSINEICKKSNLDKVSALRCLEYLQNKGLLKINSKEKKVVEIGINGALYKKIGLPERRLLNILVEKNIIPLQDAQKITKLTDDELKVSLGVLKKKAMIELKNGKIFLEAKKEEISKKLLEEQLLEILPIKFNELKPEQLHALESLKNRKEIIKITNEKEISFLLTDSGEKIIKKDLNEENLIENISTDLIKKESWRGKKFRRYDITAPVSKIYGGKRHFVNQSIDYGRKIWTDMGFEEMSGDFVVSSFWNFDALFTAQDHPVRELQDTFFLNKKSELSDKKIVSRVKESHEKGVDESKGWQYKWDEEESKKLVLRTHTTCISSQTLSKINENELPKKFFAIGKCFRNETVDWSHGFEFNQTEGIVIDENANFRNLLGYLKQFFSKMGFEQIRFRPAYFPYTEPSVEIDVFHPERKVWLELGGAGIFRPEVTIPLIGKNIPILAWGPGFDRILMDYYQIKDLRELYKNDITQLRKMKFWIK